MGGEGRRVGFYLSAFPQTRDLNYQKPPRSARDFKLSHHHHFRHWKGTILIITRLNKFS